MKFMMLILTAAALAGCTQGTGYVDPTKALNDTADGKANVAALTAFAQEKRTEVAALRAEAGKDKDPITSKAKLAQADQLEKTGQDELVRRQNEGAKRISAGLERILPKLREAHHLQALALRPLDVDPSLDLTAELVTRYNAGEGEPPPPVAANANDTKKVADLERKVAAMEAAEKARAAPPVPPLALQGPPIRKQP